MALVKYKAIASYLDRFFFTRVIEVDDSIYVSEDERIDYLTDSLFEDFKDSQFENWDEDGGEIVEDFSIDEIIRIN